MAAIPFTDRELKRALRELSFVAISHQSPLKNPHRLLLFYAVECGLKAVWLKRQARSLFNQEDIGSTGHDLRQLLKELKVSGQLSLPENLELSAVTQNNRAVLRRGNIGILHQTWRYGGECLRPSDQECERQLMDVLDWVKGELI